MTEATGLVLLHGKLPVVENYLAEQHDLLKAVQRCRLRPSERLALDAFDLLFDRLDFLWGPRLESDPDSPGGFTPRNEGPLRPRPIPTALYTRNMFSTFPPECGSPSGILFVSDCRSELKVDRPVRYVIEAAGASRCGNSTSESFDAIA